MKRIAIVLAVALLVFFSFKSYANRQWIDWTFQFNYAEVRMPDGSTIKGKCDSWRDYEDGDQIQVTIDGITYLTHATNVVLATKEPQK